MHAPSVQARTFKLVNADAGRPLPRRNTPAPPAQPGRTDPRVSTDDPRWVLAVRAELALRGGRAAVLTPDRRRSLERLAGRMGLRPFDAALVIAIVQDAGRRGESIADRGPVSRLALIRPADLAPPAVGPLAAVSIGLAVVIFTAGVGLLTW